MTVYIYFNSIYFCELLGSFLPASKQHRREMKNKIEEKEGEKCDV